MPKLDRADLDDPVSIERVQTRRFGVQHDLTHVLPLPGVVQQVLHVLHGRSQGSSVRITNRRAHVFRHRGFARQEALERLHVHFRPGKNAAALFVGGGRDNGDLVHQFRSRSFRTAAECRGRRCHRRDEHPETTCGPRRREGECAARSVSEDRGFPRLPPSEGHRGRPRPSGQRPRARYRTKPGPPDRRRRRCDARRRPRPRPACRARNMAAVVDLPIPMDPVSPRIVRRHARTAARSSSSTVGV
jgi:hypothetical protein